MYFSYLFLCLFPLSLLSRFLDWLSFHYSLVLFYWFWSCTFYFDSFSHYSWIFHVPILKSEVNTFSILLNSTGTIKCTESDHSLHLSLPHYHCLVFLFHVVLKSSELFFKISIIYVYQHIYQAFLLLLLLVSHHPLWFISLITLAELLNPSAKESWGKEIYPTVLISGLNKVIFVKVLYKW